MRPFAPSNPEISIRPPPDRLKTSITRKQDNHNEHAKCLTEEASGHRGGTAMPTQRPNQNQASHTETRTTVVVEDPTTQSPLGSTPEMLLWTRQGKSLVIHLHPPPLRRHPNAPSGTRLSSARSAARMLRQVNTSSITGWSSPNWKLAHPRICNVLFPGIKEIGRSPFPWRDPDLTVFFLGRYAVNLRTRGKRGAAIAATKQFNKGKSRGSANDEEKRVV